MLSRIKTLSSLIFILPLTFCSIKTIEDKDETELVVLDISKTYQVNLSISQTSFSNKDSVLILLINSDIEARATLGPIVHDLSKQVSNKRLPFNKFQIKNNQGEVGIEVTQKELEKVDKYIQIVKQLNSAIKSSDSSKLKELVDTTIFSNSSLKKILENSKSRIKGQNKYLGFEVRQEQNQSYCMIVYAYPETKTLMGVTFKSKSKSDLIHAIQF